MNRTSTRTAADRCPGVLRPHQAADGAMVRVRVPGGQTTGAALARLSAVAVRFGSGLLQLTSRASVQVRGLPSDLPGAVAEEIAAAGFLPSADHERVRNIAASPLTGLSGGRADLRPMVAALDRALIADPALADLPGRFLFVLDDGRQDVAGLSFDVGYCALGPQRGVVVMGSERHRVAADRAVGTMITAARAFLGHSGGAWRVSELGDGSDRSEGPGMPTPLGEIAGHASVGVALGHLTPAQIDVVAAVADGGPVVITPWRGLVIPGASAHLGRLAAAGLVVDDESVWKSLTACVGAPWCANGRADTRAWAMAVAAAGPSGPTHLSGCERRCGAPATEHRDLVAP